MGKIGEVWDFGAVPKIPHFPDFSLFLLKHSSRFEISCFYDRYIVGIDVLAERGVYFIEC